MSTPPSSTAPVGRFIAVVGPSGAGKDSVMEGLCALRPDLHNMRRVITRAPDAGGEVFDAVSVSAFADLVAEGAFVLHWTAHGLSYGIPATAHDEVARGRDVLVNLSRGVVAEAAVMFENVVILHVTAPADVLSKRVANRGREQGAAVQKRLTRATPAMPKNLPMILVDNSGVLPDAVATALAGLYPERA